MIKSCALSSSLARRRAALGDVGDQIGEAADAGELQANIGGGFAARRLGQEGAGKAELLRPPSAAPAACATGRTAPDSDTSPK